MMAKNSARFVFTAEAGFNRLRWDSSVLRISCEDMHAATEAVDASAERCPLLVHLGALTHISPEARQIIIESTRAQRVAILSEDLITKVVTAFAYTSVVPIRFFTDETKATRWLLTPHTTTAEVLAESTQQPRTLFLNPRAT